MGAEQRALQSHPHHNGINVRMKGTVMHQMAGWCAALLLLAAGCMGGEDDSEGPPQSNPTSDSTPAGSSAQPTADVPPEPTVNGTRRAADVYEGQATLARIPDFAYHDGANCLKFNGDDLQRIVDGWINATWDAGGLWAEELNSRSKRLLRSSYAPAGRRPCRLTCGTWRLVETFTFHSNRQWLASTMSKPL